jgi:hypothetical protein
MEGNVSLSSSSSNEEGAIKAYRPEADPSEGETETQVTIRTLLVGGLAGFIVGVGNLYVGLKIGIVFFPIHFWSFNHSPLSIQSSGYFLSSSLLSSSFGSTY